MLNQSALPVSQAAEYLAFALESDVPVMLWGSPGIGKTETIRDVSDRVAAATAAIRAAADFHGSAMVETTFATILPEDLTGLPKADGEYVRYLKPDLLRRLEAIPGPFRTLFIDECNAVGPQMQVPMMQLVLERRMGPHPLPAGTRIVMAGNRISDRAAAQRQPTALANRLMHLDVKEDLAGWLKWAARSGIDTTLIAFMQLRGSEWLNKFDPAAPDVRAFATPRSWAMAARAMSLPDRLRPHAIAAIVGQAAAADLEAFILVARTMPSLQTILADPDGAPLPDQLHARYAAACAIARACKPGTISAFLRYAERMGAEFGAVVVQQSTARDPGLNQTDSVIRWNAANAELTM